MAYYTFLDPLDLLSTMVVVVHRNTHRSIAGEDIYGAAAPAKRLTRARDDARKKELALTMRELTVKLMVWSMTLIAARVELDFTIIGEVLRKGTMKFVQLRAPLDACFVSDDLRDEALLLDHALEAGVACTSVFFLDPNDR
jgi:hypothetical protein